MKVYHHVSMNEAMKQLKSGKPIKWFSSTTNKVICFRKGDYNNRLLHDLSLKDICEGDWSVEI